MHCTIIALRQACVLTPLTDGLEADDGLDKTYLLLLAQFSVLGKDFLLPSFPNADLANLDELAKMNNHFQDTMFDSARQDEKRYKNEMKQHVASLTFQIITNGSIVVSRMCTRCSLNLTSKATTSFDA